MPKAPEKVSKERETENGGPGEFLHGAKFTPFDLIGGPVDLANAALSVVGQDHPEPVLGSDYLINRYSDLMEIMGLEFRKPTGSAAENAGRLAGSLATGVGGARALGAELLETIGDNKQAVESIVDIAIEKAAAKEVKRGNRSRVTAEEEEAFREMQLGHDFVDEFFSTLEHAAKNGSMQPEVASKLATKILDSGLDKEEQAKLIYRLVDADPSKVRKAFKKDLQERRKGGLASLFARTTV